MPEFSHVNGDEFIDIQHVPKLPHKVETRIKNAVFQHLP